MWHDQSILLNVRSVCSQLPTNVRVAPEEGQLQREWQVCCQLPERHVGLVWRLNAWTEMDAHLMHGIITYSLKLIHYPEHGCEQLLTERSIGPQGVCSTYLVSSCIYASK
jgi:hypothetical protein